MFFPWKNEYSVGLEEIDLQHRLLINMIDDLYVAIYENEGSEAIPALLGHLKDYTRDHFAKEKTMMEEAGYEGLHGHLQEHDKMIAKVAEIELKNSRGQIGGLSPLVVYLRNWLENHICIIDKAMARELMNKNQEQ